MELWQSPLEGRIAVLPNPAFWSGRQVFLTGHTGFKGAWLAVWLQRLGAIVTGFSLPGEPGSLGAAIGIDTRLAATRGDIRDAAVIRSALQAASPQIVVHLAAQALVRRSYADPIETFETNVLGTAQVLEAVRACPGILAVVVVTTDKCYEPREWAWPYRETDALGGRDPYSASKAGAELVAACWRSSFLAEAGVAVATARAGNVVGGGDPSPDRLVPDCIRAFAAHETVRIRSPNATRPWQNVLDPLCGYLLLAERLAFATDFARAWNFGPGPDDVRPVGEVVRILAQAWGDDAGWSVDAGAHPHEAGLLAVDASLARARLGWRPRLPLDLALAATARWYRRSLEGADQHDLMLADIDDYQADLCP